MSTESDLTITLSEPKTRTEKAQQAQKRTFEIDRVEYNGKQVDCKGGKFLHNASGGAAKKVATRVCKTLVPDGECIINLWIKEKIKSGEGKKYGYWARRYYSGKKEPLKSVNVLKTVDSDGNPLSDDDIKAQKQKIADQREKIKKTIPEENWLKNDDGEIIGILQEFGYSVELKSLKKRTDDKGEETGSVIAGDSISESDSATSP